MAQAECMQLLCLDKGLQRHDHAMLKQRRSLKHGIPITRPSDIFATWTGLALLPASGEVIKYLNDVQGAPKECRQFSAEA